MIEIIICTLVFYFPFAAAHGKVAQNLAQKEYKDKRLANIYKGEWHNLFFKSLLEASFILGSINNTIINCEKWKDGFDWDCVTLVGWLNRGGG